MESIEREIQHHFEVIDGIATHYVLAGSGPLLLLFHGYTPGSCVEVEWPDTVEAFCQAGFKVCAFDQPGFGRSDNPEDYSVERGIRHAKALIAFLAPRSYAMWGCSMGGYIASRIALEDSRVKQLVLMPASMLPPTVPIPLTSEGLDLVKELQEYTPSLDNARRVLSKVLFHQHLVTNGLVERFHAMTVGKNALAAMRRRDASRPQPIYADLKNLRSSTLIMWGADDLSAVIDRALSLAAIVRQAEFHIFQQCRHWPQIDQSHRVKNLVLDFLRLG